MEFYEHFKIPIKQGYGLSETSPTLHMHSVSEWNASLGSVGKLVPNCEAMIVDEDGKERKRGESGELWVKGPNIMLGYLNNEAATKDCITADGWFKTGDIGYIDENEYLFLTV